MILSDFDYILPDELIAQTPIEPRDDARLLVYNRANDEIIDTQVKYLDQYLPGATMIVANNSRVRNARLSYRNLKKADDSWNEILILSCHAELDNCHAEFISASSTFSGDSSHYEVIVSGKGNKIGDELLIKGLDDYLQYKAQIIDLNPSDQMQTYIVKIFTSKDSFEKLMQEQGVTPLPPYIHQKPSQNERYQTTFSKQIGSAAAPTAGLHFTENLTTDLIKKGHSWEEVTLHVGLGTFLPLKNINIIENKLHTETTEISVETGTSLRSSQRRSILAIGTTTVRTLESHYIDGDIKSGTLDTNIFIYPGYKFEVVNHLMTNFHLPKSSLLLLVAAFIGNDIQKNIVLSESEMIERLHKIYAHAIKEKYRFFSFGDAMLIL